MSRKNRQTIPPSKRVGSKGYRSGVFVEITSIDSPPRFTSHAAKIANALGMSREQLAGLLKSGDEKHAIQVMEKASQPCGECQLCCELLQIEIFNKPPYQVCPKQCATGCSIHGNHPDECKNYMCAWKMRWIDGGLNFRPDKLGAIFDLDKMAQGEVLRVWQTAPDMVLNNPEVRRFTIELANQFGVPVFAYYKDDRRSVFLIPALSRWRPFFEAAFPEYPVYDLPGE